jgi:hypothetical protein
MGEDDRGSADDVDGDGLAVAGADIGRFPADRQNEPGSPEMRSLRAPSSNQSTGQRLSRY